MSSRHTSRALAAGLLALTLLLAPTAIAKNGVGKPAPSFTMTMRDGKPLLLEQLKGKVVLINFWATWCAPCRAEMPMINRYYKEVRAQGFEVVGVLSHDPTAPTTPSFKRLAEVLSYPLATAYAGGLKPIKRKLPTNIIIDRKGVVRFVKLGFLPDIELRKQVSKLLKEAP